MRRDAGGDRGTAFTLLSCLFGDRRSGLEQARIVAITDTHVSFRWKDRANNDAPRIEMIPGGEFVKRYLRHVLPRGLRAIRYHGFCHPAAKTKRERIAFHTSVADAMEVRKASRHG